MKYIYKVDAICAECGDKIPAGEVVTIIEYRKLCECCVEDYEEKHGDTW
jgi:hypothetical protein